MNANAGSVVCDAWLSLDYTVSNASVANLLLISFDRYMCVTRPLKYRVRRTSRCAIVMIVGAWVVSALLWTPWIVAWPFIDVSFFSLHCRGSRLWRTDEPRTDETC